MADEVVSFLAYLRRFRQRPKSNQDRIAAEGQSKGPLDFEVEEANRRFLALKQHMTSQQRAQAENDLEIIDCEILTLQHIGGR